MISRAFTKEIQRQAPKARLLQKVRLLSTEAGGSTPSNGEKTGEVHTQTEREVPIGSEESFVRDEYSWQEEGHEEAEETEEEYQTKQRILKAALPFVHLHGWTSKAIAAGAEAEGLPSISHGMFPRGGVELIFYFYRECNEQLVEQLKAKLEEMKQTEQKIKTGPFIRDAMETRLRMITPYMDKWPQAMGIQALPQNAPEAWANLGRMMDDIWYYAGDRSNDFNYYTKRTSLAAVYKATEIFMLQDTSEDWQETWNFLDRRLDDVVKTGKVFSNVQQSGTVLSEAAYGMCLMTRNILGMNSKFR